MAPQNVTMIYDNDMQTFLHEAHVCAESVWCLNVFALSFTFSLNIGHDQHNCPVLLSCVEDRW